MADQLPRPEEMRSGTFDRGGKVPCTVRRMGRRRLICTLLSHEASSTSSFCWVAGLLLLFSSSGPAVAVQMPVKSGRVCLVRITIIT